jgi:hypothetical protein
MEEKMENYLVLNYHILQILNIVKNDKNISKIDKNKDLIAFTKQLIENFNKFLEPIENKNSDYWL